MSQTHGAYIIQEDRTLKLQDVLLPQLGDGEILVKVRSSQSAFVAFLHAVLTDIL